MEKHRAGFCCDITGFTDKKIETILAYSSQFMMRLQRNQVAYIFEFLESLNYRSRDLGRLAG
jgi:hypothetical protein